MEKAESLKCAGNELFSQGKVDMAIVRYEQGIQELDLVSSSDSSVVEPDKLSLLQSVLWSNLSQALFTAGRMPESALAAKRGAHYDPRNSKIVFRLVRALHAAGRSFEAFVNIILHLKPLVATAKELAVLLGGLQEQICDSIGISELAESFSLQLHGTGIGGIALNAIQSGKVLFVEKRLAFSRLDPSKAIAPPGVAVTNEVLFTNFAQQLEAIQSDKSSQGCADWKRISNEMAGSWPRRPEDIPINMQEESRRMLRALFGSSSSSSMSESDMYELLNLTLVCRYNCFHSGFFRACALVNHSCNPNAAMKFNPSVGAVTLVAVRDIKKGEALSVKYLDDADYMAGLGRRRELLYQSWLFQCDCDRCTADENQETALCEYIRCPSCRDPSRFVYCPAPPSLSKDLVVLVPAPCMACAGCGEVPKWTSQLLDDLNAFRVAHAWTTQIRTLQELTISLVELRFRASQLVHPEHWAYRTLLYAFCLCAQGPIAQSYQLLVNRQWSIAECAREFIRSFGWSSSTGNATDYFTSPSMQLTGGAGGDMLQCVLDFIRRIEPFYPPQQAWALHVTICRLVLYNLLSPSASPNALQLEACVKMIQNHAKFIGPKESQSFQLVFDAQRKELGLSFSAKVLKDLKLATHDSI